MTITTISSREMNQNISLAKKSALSGPVFITNRGEPEHVLLSYADYLSLTQQKRSIVEALQMAEEVEFEPTKLAISITPADLS